MATISGKYLIHKFIETISSSYNNDEVQLHKNKLNIVPYFPDSPVNIISETTLTESMKYDELTWVLTKSEYYILLGIFGST